MSAVIARTLIELVVSLESSDEDAVSVEAAAAFQEDATASLGALSGEERSELVALIGQMAEESQSEKRRQILEELPDGLDLIDE